MRKPTTWSKDSLEVHRDAIREGQRVLLVDDLLATGGTAAATVRLVRRLGGQVMSALFLVELEFLNGRIDVARKVVSRAAVSGVDHARPTSPQPLSSGMIRAVTPSWVTL